MISRRGESYFAHWGASVLLSMAGLVLTYSGENYPFMRPSKGALAYGLFAGSLMFCWSGLRHFNSKPIPWTAPAVCVGATSALYGVLMIWLPDGRAAMTAVFLCLICLMVQVIHELWAAPDRSRLASRYIVGWALSMFLLLFIASLITTAIDPALVADPNNTFYSLIADQTLSILVYIGLLAMAGERAYARLERQAMTDPLTGVVNRRGLGEIMRRSQRPRAGRQPSVSVLMCDIDHFKAINDVHGHDAGDTVLKQFSERLSAVFRRRSDIVARWGGEEFVAILNDTPLQEAVRLAEQFRRLVETMPFTIASGTIGVTVSVGVTAFGRVEWSIETAMRQADSALYLAKNDGRNSVRIHEDASDTTAGSA